MSWRGAGALEAAAREGARQAITEASSSSAARTGTSGAPNEAREAAESMLGAVRQLEAALSARIDDLAATLGNGPAEPTEPGEQSHAPQALKRHRSEGKPLAATLKGHGQCWAAIINTKT